MMSLNDTILPLQQCGGVRAMSDNDVDVSTRLLYIRQIKDSFMSSNRCLNMSELSISLVLSGKVLMNLKKGFISNFVD